ncbi:centrosomal protein of 290 kDa-like [Harmonia axyridis]|uniref:centrosomal protein of 290 kDa-like n=1 Tax=Harmonia axyridis TaxID=115357 RepID=UPI001E2765F4|nr:centrosomal protein of 290 kDa-like [Harmonia axyridis]
MKEDRKVEPDKRQVRESDKQKEDTGKDAIKGPKIDATKEKKADLDRKLKDEEKQLDRKKDQEGLKEREDITKTAGIPGGKIDMKEDRKVEPDKRQVQESDKQKGDTGKDAIKGPKIDATKEKKGDLDRKLKDEEKQLDRKKDQEGLKEREDITKTAGIPGGKIDMKEDRKVEPDKRQVQESDKQKGDTGKDAIKGPKIDATKEKKGDLDRKLKDEEKQLDRKKDQEGLKEREEITKTAGIPGGKIDMKEDRKVEPDKRQVQESDKQKGDTEKDAIKGPKIGATKEKKGDLDRKLKDEEKQLDRKKDQDGLKEREDITKTAGIPGGKIDMKEDRKVEPDKRQVQESDKQKGDTGKDAIKGPKIDATKEKKGDLDRKLKDEEKQLDRKKDQEGLKEREEITKTAGIPGGKIDMKEDRKVEPDKRQVQESDKQKGDTGKDAIKGPKIDATKEKKADLDRKLKDEEKQLDRKKDQEGLKEREDITKTAGIPGGKIDMKEDRKVEPDKRQVPESDKQKGDTGKDAIKGPKIDATKEKQGDIDRKLKDEEKQLDRKKDQERLKKREEITKTAGIPGGKIDMKEDRKVEPDKRQVQESDKQKGDTGKDAIKGPKIDATKEKKAELDRKLKDEEKQRDRKKDQEGLKEREEITKTAGIPGGKIDMKEDRKVEPDKRQVQESEKQKGDTGKDAIKGPKIDATKEKKADLDRKLKDEEKQLDRKKDQEGLKEREDITKTAGIPGGKIDMKEDRKVEPDKRQVQESDKQKGDTGKDAIKGPKIDATKEKKGDFVPKLKDEEKQLDRKKDQEGLKEREEITKTAGIPGGKIDMKEDRKVEPDKRQVQESDKQKGDTGKDAIKGPKIDATKEKKAELDRKLKDEEKQRDRKKDQEGLKEREEITKTAGIPGGKIDMKEDRKVEPDKRQVQESEKQKGDTGKDAIKGPKIDATKEKKADLDRKLKDEEKQLDRKKDQEGLKEREDITKTAGIPGGKIDMKEDRKVEPDKRQVQESDKQKGDTGKDAIKGPKIDATKEKKADLDRKLKDEEKQLGRKKDQEGLKEKEEITKTAGIPGGKIDMKEDRKVEPDKQKGDTGKDAIKGPKIDATKEKKAELDRKLKDEEKQLDRQKDQEGLKEREEITKTAGIPGGKIDMKEDRKVEPDKRQVQESDKQKVDIGKDAIKDLKIDATKEKKADLDRKLKDEEKQLDRKKDQEGLKEREEITKTAGIPGGKIDMKEDRKVEPDKRQVQESDKQKGDTGKDAIKGPKIDATKEKKTDLDRKLKDEVKQLDRRKDQEGLKEREEITKTAGIPGGKIHMKEDRKVALEKQQTQESEKQKGVIEKDAMKSLEIDAKKEKEAESDRKRKDEKIQQDRKKDQGDLKKEEEITKTGGIPSEKIEIKKDRTSEHDKRQVLKSEKQIGVTGKDTMKDHQIGATKEKEPESDRKQKDEEKQQDRKKDQGDLKKKDEITKTRGIPSGKIEMKKDRTSELDKRMVQESDKQKGVSGKYTMKSFEISGPKEKEADLHRKQKDEELQPDREKDQVNLQKKDEITKTGGIPGEKIKMKIDRKGGLGKRLIEESDKHKGITGTDTMKSLEISSSKEKEADSDRKRKDEEIQLDRKKHQEKLKEKDEITKTKGVPDGKIDIKKESKGELDQRKVQESEKQKGIIGKDAMKGLVIGATKEKEADLRRKQKYEERQPDRKKDQEEFKKRDGISKDGFISSGGKEGKIDKDLGQESYKQKDVSRREEAKTRKIDDTGDKKADFVRKIKDEERQLKAKKREIDYKKDKMVSDRFLKHISGKAHLKSDKIVGPDRENLVGTSRDHQGIRKKVHMIKGRKIIDDKSGIGRVIESKGGTREGSRRTDKSSGKESVAIKQKLNELDYTKISDEDRIGKEKKKGKKIAAYEEKPKIRRNINEKRSKYEILKSPSCETLKKYQEKWKCSTQVEKDMQTLETEEKGTITNIRGTTEPEKNEKGEGSHKGDIRKYMEKTAIRKADEYLSLGKNMKELDDERHIEKQQYGTGRGQDITKKLETSYKNLKIEDTKKDEHENKGLDKYDEETLEGQGLEWPYRDSKRTKPTKEELDIENKTEEKVKNHREQYGTKRNEISYGHDRIHEEVKMDRENINYNKWDSDHDRKKNEKQSGTRDIETSDYKITGKKQKLETLEWERQKTADEDLKDEEIVLKKTNDYPSTENAVIHQELKVENRNEKQNDEHGTKDDDRNETQEKSHEITYNKQGLKEVDAKDKNFPKLTIDGTHVSQLEQLMNDQSKLKDIKQIEKERTLRGIEVSLNSPSAADIKQNETVEKSYNLAGKQKIVTDQAEENKIHNKSQKDVAPLAGTEKTEDTLDKEMYSKLVEKNGDYDLINEKRDTMGPEFSKKKGKMTMTDRGREKEDKSIEKIEDFGYNEAKKKYMKQKTNKEGSVKKFKTFKEHYDDRGKYDSSENTETRGEIKNADRNPQAVKDRDSRDSELKMETLYRRQKKKKPSQIHKKNLKVIERGEGNYKQKNELRKKMKYDLPRFGNHALQFKSKRKNLPLGVVGIPLSRDMKKHMTYSKVTPKLRSTQSLPAMKHNKELVFKSNHDISKRSQKPSRTKSLTFKRINTHKNIGKQNQQKLNKLLFKQLGTEFQILTDAEKLKILGSLNKKKHKILNRKTVVIKIKQTEVHLRIRSVGMKKKSKSKSQKNQSTININREKEIYRKHKTRINSRKKSKNRIIDDSFHVRSSFSIDRCGRNISEEKRYLKKLKTFISVRRERGNNRKEKNNESNSCCCCRKIKKSSSVQEFSGSKKNILKNKTKRNDQLTDRPRSIYVPTKYGKKDIKGRSVGDFGSIVTLKRKFSSVMNNANGNSYFSNKDQNKEGKEVHSVGAQVGINRKRQMEKPIKNKNRREWKEVKLMMLRERRTETTVNKELQAADTNLSNELDTYSDECSISIRQSKSCCYISNATNKNADEKQMKYKDSKNLLLHNVESACSNSKAIDLLIKSFCSKEYESMRSFRFDGKEEIGLCESRDCVRNTYYSKKSRESKSKNLNDKEKIRTTKRITFGSDIDLECSKVISKYGVNEKPKSILKNPLYKTDLHLFPLPGNIIPFSTSLLQNTDDNMEDQFSNIETEISNIILETEESRSVLTLSNAGVPILTASEIEFIKEMKEKFGNFTPKSEERKLGNGRDHWREPCRNLALCHDGIKSNAGCSHNRFANENTSHLKKPKTVELNIDKAVKSPKAAIKLKDLIDKTCLPHSKPSADEKRLEKKHKTKSDSRKKKDHFQKQESISLREPKLSHMLPMNKRSIVRSFYQVLFLFEIDVFGSSTQYQQYAEETQNENRRQESSLAKNYDTLCRSGDHNDLRNSVIFMRLDLLKKHMSLVRSITGSNSSLRLLVEKAILSTECCKKDKNGRK